MSNAENIFRDIIDTIGRRYALKYFIIGTLFGYLLNSALGFYITNRESIDTFISKRTEAVQDRKETTDSFKYVPPAPRKQENTNARMAKRTEVDQGSKDTNTHVKDEPVSPSNVVPVSKQATVDEDIIVLVGGIASKEVTRYKWREFRKRRIDCIIQEVNGSYRIVIVTFNRKMKDVIMKKLQARGII